MPAGSQADFPAVMERMRNVRSGISKLDSAERFRELGLEPEAEREIVDESGDRWISPLMVRR